ncbi:MAG: c-type cytochrome [Bacteroidetes bacterium]|nr:c-type cytochrome [Fibrella sp.]
MTKPAYYVCLLGVGVLSLLGFNTNFSNLWGDDPTPVRTPAQELTSFRLEPGLKIQLVAAEPMVQDPVVFTFDADGRLWVVEMRGYMRTIDGDGERERTGRVSVLEDKNGDGIMDVSTVYLDSLIMPRAITLVPGGALVAENDALWLTQDLNGDLRADTKTLIDAKYAGGALPEHAGNGLWRSVDNWYYNAKSRFRYRMTDGKWLRDSTEFRGQWGLSHDDEGRLYYNYNWSQLHADLVPPNYLSRNKNHTPTTGIDHGLTVDRRIYPIRSNPAVNRGYIPNTLDKEGRLLEFTAACSPLVYRGKTLPAAFHGNVFVCEPAGNLIKRNAVDEQGVMLNAHDPHPGTEFLASTDERFRPTHLATGPDGALYVADMYKGIVQHNAYMTPYLREQTLARKLEAPINRGRIWRIVPTSWKPVKTAKLSTATPAELVGYLSNPDGWYRDMAQRLLVERNDKSIGSALTSLALKGDNQLGRFHALWTLEGLNALQLDVLLALVSDQNPLISTTALRLLEPFAKTDKQVRATLAKTVLANWEKAPVEQVLQMALSAQVLDPLASHQLLAGIAERHGSAPLMRDAVLSSLYNQEFAFLQRLWQSPQWQTPEPAKEIFVEMLTTAIIHKRDPAELTALLALLDVDKQAFGWQQKAVLTAMSIQGKNGKGRPIKLTAPPTLLARTDADGSRFAAVASLFDWPGHTVQMSVSQKKNPLNEDEQKLFALGRQHYLTTCAGCHGTDGAGLNRFAPPLIGSDWVTGDEKRLALIVLHGMEGPVDVAGKVYDAPSILPIMPAHSTMDDATITAILMYIRNEWGNDAGPIGKKTVGTTRITSQGRVMPWKASELKKYVLEANANSGK